jgi:hypothetical protein
MARNLLTLFLLIFFFSFHAPHAEAVIHLGSANTVTQGSGLIGYWPLDGAVTNWATGVTRDLSGQGNNDQLVSMSTTTSPATGKIGQALNFNGTNSYVEPPTGMSVPFGRPNWVGTISLWVKNSGGNQIPISAYRDSNNQSTFAYLTIDTAFKYTNCDISGAPFCTTISSSATFDGRTWNHFIFTSDGAGHYQLAVNGVATAITHTFNLIDGGDFPRIEIGWQHNHTFGDGFFSGSLDDVRIYNRALSANDVKQLYGLGTVNAAHANTGAVSNGLLAYWPLDGSVTNWATGQTRDISGNDNTGQLISMSTSTSPVSGKIGQALNFTGSNSITAPAITMGSQLTVSVWESSTVSSGQYAMVFNDNGVDGFAVVKNYQSGGTQDEVTLNMRNGSPTGRLDCHATTDDGLWHNIIFTYDGAAMRCYIDGVARESQASTGDTLTASTVKIGAGSGYSNFNGKMDDVRIYSRALSPNDVKQLYATGASKLGQSSGASSGLVVYWPFDGSTINWSTQTVTDKSGQGNNATTTNLSTTTAPVAGKFGQALTFPGTQSFIKSSQLLNVARVTMSVWVYFQTLPAAGTCVTPLGFMNDSVTPSLFDKDIVVDPNGKATFYVYDGSSHTTSAPSSGVSAGSWHLFTATADGSAARMYVDGTEVGSVASGDTYTNYGNQNIFIGSQINTVACGLTAADLPANTKIDDVRIYSRALSATEIRQLYNGGR